MIMMIIIIMTRNNDSSLNTGIIIKINDNCYYHYKIYNQYTSTNFVLLRTIITIIITTVIVKLLNLSIFLRFWRL